MSTLNNLKICIVYCGTFKSIIVNNPTEEEIIIIKQIKKKLSHDEYAGYSPEQQNIYSELVNFINSIKKFIPHKEL